MSSNYAMNQNFDSDDEDEQKQFQSTQDGTIFLIDCAASMFVAFEEDDETTCLFTKCLRVLERLLMNRIISDSKSLLSVVLYNTDKSPDPIGDFAMTDNPLPVPKNCAILIPLQRIEAGTIQFVKNLQNSEDFMDFDNRFGHSVDAKISDILWLCSTMFSSCGKKISIPQIMWFTNEDLPYPVGSTDHHQAFQKAKDLQQFQLELQFHPMKEDFNGDLFYKELICQLLDEDVEDFTFPTPQLNERLLLQRMFRRDHKKRTRCYLNVELSENVKFGVGIYSFVRGSFVPKPVKLARDTNEEIVAKRAYKYATVEEGNDGDVSNVSHLEKHLQFEQKLDPSMTIKYQLVGGEKINFTLLEAYEIKQMMEPKIKVLGVKPSSVLCDRNFIKSPYFVYPSNSRVLNSSVLFRALWEQCLADDKIVICAFTMRLKSYPRLVALVPQEQARNNDDVVRSDGFRMVFIPFAGDIRDISEVFSGAESVDEEISTNMKKIVSKLRIKYDAAMFDNPTVKLIYGQIEEQLFGDPDDRPDPELLADSTMPNLEGQDQRIEEFVNKLEELVGGFDVVPVKTTKRKGSEEREATKRKKLDPEDINEEQILAKCQNNDIKQITVPMLRAYLSSKKIVGLQKLTKAQLVEKIVELAK